MRTEFLRLITTEGLGYCCLWAFFELYPQTEAVAERLGVSPTTVKRWRRRWRAGQLHCTAAPNCLMCDLDKLRKHLLEKPDHRSTEGGEKA